LAELAGLLDVALQENPHYRVARRLGQLAPVRLVRVGPGASEAYLERLHRSGQRLGDIKPVALSRLDGWAGWLVER
jgi:hypothetical protein